ARWWRSTTTARAASSNGGSGRTGWRWAKRNWCGAEVADSEDDQETKVPEGVPPALCMAPVCGIRERLQVVSVSRTIQAQPIRANLRIRRNHQNGMHAIRRRWWMPGQQRRRGCVAGRCDGQEAARRQQGKCRHDKKLFHVDSPLSV